MKYKYYDQRGRLLCEADTPITFNLILYPIWKFIKCRIDEGEAEVVMARVKQSEEDKVEEKENLSPVKKKEEVRTKASKKKK